MHWIDDRVNIVGLCFIDALANQVRRLRFNLNKVKKLNLSALRLYYKTIGYTIYY